MFDPMKPDTYDVTITGRPYSSHGILDSERRRYTVKTFNTSDAREEAIRLAHAEEIEHVAIVDIEKLN